MESVNEGIINEEYFPNFINFIVRDGTGQIIIVQEIHVLLVIMSLV